MGRRKGKGKEGREKEEERGEKRRVQGGEVSLKSVPMGLACRHVSGRGPAVAQDIRPA